MSMAIFIIQSVRLGSGCPTKNIRMEGKKKHKASVITVFVICLELVNGIFMEV